LVKSEEENFKMVFVKKNMYHRWKELYRTQNYENSWQKRRDWRQREAKQPTGLYVGKSDQLPETTVSGDQGIKNKLIDMYTNANSFINKKT